MSIWNPTLVGTSLNLRIPRGHVASDFTLSADVARSQLSFNPDIICNYEDMEGCDSTGYFQALELDYKRIAATDDKQGRGVSCWIKKEYSAVKVYSMKSPHFMHVKVKNADDIELNLIILRILVSNSGSADFKARWNQWQTVMQYVDSIKDEKNIALLGDWNHGVIGKIRSYRGKSREHFNFQMIKKSLYSRCIKVIPMQGYSFKGYMAIDHIATSSSIVAENARYENIYGSDVDTIGIPDHSFIVSDLRMCE